MTIADHDLWRYLHILLFVFWLGADVGVQRIWVPHLLAGAGYAQPLGGRNAIYLQVLWEVLQNPNSVYYGQGPIISGGVGLGF